tara:strand:+ start:470 stop:961 length:492 start_codon:yes stop_codon:yes gene_type:complete
MSSILKVDTIQNTGGATGLTIDSTGRMLTPARPAFKAHSSASSWQSFGNTNENVMPFDTTQHNVGSHWDTSNYRFVAPCNGIYFFYGQLYHDDTTQCQLRIKVNGSAVTFVNNRTQGTTAGASLTYELSTGDQVNMTAKLNTTNSTDWYADPSYAFLCGYLIG